MQTIKKYQEYTKQLEGEVKTWHDAYDALKIENSRLVNTLMQNKKTIETTAAELDGLRKRELEFDMAQAKIKELEEQLTISEERNIECRR